MTWFWINTIVLASFIWRTSKRYGTVLNPVAFFGGYYFMAAVVAPLVYDKLGLLNDLDTSSVASTSMLSAVYFAALASTFLFEVSPFQRFFNWLLDHIASFEITSTNSGAASSLYLLQYIALFGLLMLGSGAGLLWITDSRDAYQFHRASVGVIWSLCQATLLLAFLNVLFTKQRRLWTLCIFTILFATAALFLGSKSSALAYFVLALFYADLTIKRIRASASITIGALILAGALFLQMQQGTAEGLLDTLIYFDYFRNSAAFIDRFSEFGHRYGALTLSYLWYYVPRALYPSKPYAYGQVMATDMLFPGAAEDMGATPGLLQWTAGYGDFGIAGVILVGLFTGFVSKGAFETFRERKDLASAAIFAQVGLIYYVEMFPNAPFVIFFIWLSLQIALARFAQMFFTRNAANAVPIQSASHGGFTGS